MGRFKTPRVTPDSDDKSQASFGSSMVRGDTSLCPKSTGDALWGQQGQGCWDQPGWTPQLMPRGWGGEGPAPPKLPGNAGQGKGCGEQAQSRTRGAPSASSCLSASSLHAHVQGHPLPGGAPRPLLLDIARLQGPGQGPASAQPSPGPPFPHLRVKGSWRLSCSGQKGSQTLATQWGPGSVGSPRASGLLGAGRSAAPVSPAQGQV